jgi:hypothetical protein
MQKIEIGVKADLTGADKALNGLTHYVDGVATAMRSAGKEGAAFTKTLAELEAQHVRIGRARDTLTKALSRPISYADAKIFENNFDKMRQGKGLGSRRLRAYNDFGDWYNGHAASFTNKTQAGHHRRFVMSVGMQGTQDAADNGAPDPSEDDGGGGGRGGGGPSNGFDRSVSRAGSMAMGFVKGGLALSGINSVMGMAGQAVDSATEEATGIDVLKRQLGDLGVDFEWLRGQTRKAGDGLGVTYTESARLAQQYAREAGNLTPEDQFHLGDQMRTGYGFSRAFGLDPSKGTQLFATMKRLGASGGAADQDNRKMAGYLADAIERSGYSGQGAELVSAIANLSDTAARYSLSAPNVLGYAGMLTGLTSSPVTGMDPANATAMLSQADSSFRSGGAMGEASQNFQFMALMRASPGMSPFEAQGLQQGGLFATTRSTFGSSKSALNGWYKGALDDVTNLDKIRAQLKRMYGSGEAQAAAAAGEFGLSIAQGQMIAGTKSMTLAQAADLDKKIQGQNPGTEIRDSIADMKNELSRVGGALLGPIVEIQKGIVAMAEHMAPREYGDAKAVAAGASQVAAGNAAAIKFGTDLKSQSTLGGLYGQDRKHYDAWKTKGRPMDIDDLIPLPKRSLLDTMLDKITPGADKRFDDFTLAQEARRTALQQYAQYGDDSGGLTPGQESMRYFEKNGWGDIQAAAIAGGFMAESKVGVDPNAVNPDGIHKGIAQWDQKRWAKMLAWAKGRGLDPTQRQTQLAFANWELQNDYPAVAAQLRGAKTVEEASNIVGHGYEATDIMGNRTAYALGLLGQTPIAPSDMAANAGAAPQHVHVTGDVTLYDRSGNQVAIAPLKPVAQPTPAGS